MTRIEVDPTLLAAGAGSQSAVAGRILELCGLIGQAAHAAAGAAGEPAVAGALSSAAATWAGSLAQLAEATSGQAQNLAAASSAYTGTDMAAMPGPR